MSAQLNFTSSQQRFLKEKKNRFKIHIADRHTCSFHDILRDINQSGHPSYTHHLKASNGGDQSQHGQNAPLTSAFPQHTPRAPVTSSTGSHAKWTFGLLPFELRPQPRPFWWIKSWTHKEHKALALHSAYTCSTPRSRWLYKADFYIAVVHTFILGIAFNLSSPISKRGGVIPIMCQTLSRKEG